MIRTITPIFSIIIALIVFFMYTKPMFADIKILDAERSKFEEAVSKAEELNAELATKLAQKRSYTATQMERLDALVPAEINEVKILTDLNTLATERRMLFGNIKVEDSESSEQNTSNGAEAQAQTLVYDDIGSTDITFSLIGTYEQFKSFLADVERSLVLMEVINVGFTVGEGDLQQFEVTVRVFALPPIKQ